MRLKELAKILGVDVSGPEDVEITGAAGLQDAGKGQITFIAGTESLKGLENSRAEAALVPLDTPAMHLPLVRVKNPRLAFARVLKIFYVEPYYATGISDKAAIGRNVVLGSELSLYPFAVVADGARIGDRVTLYPGVYIGKGSVIGDDSVIYSNVSIGVKVVIGKRVIIHAGTEIGSDGFGFVTDGGRHHKIPHIGGVIIEDDVEIGGNCCVDRATLGNTIIKQGTKIDNQVQVAHNVTIGEHCLLASQVGIAGSSTLGNYVVFGGRVGVADHTNVGDGVLAGGGSAVTKDVEPGQMIAGFNAMPVRNWLKVQAVLPKLPELKKTVTNLEKQIKEIKERMPNTAKGEQR
jgi:UDP-3-O-[3-hydroxymyristoyl] glucosamine N-acyltransferase